MHRHQARFIYGLVAAMLLQSAALVGQASAQCADPRGNSYCQNNGQVTFTTPANPSKPPTQPCADPRGNAYCQGSSSSQTTQPAAPPVQPAQTGGTAATNGNNAPALPAIQSNAPSAPNASMSIDPPSAPAGSTVSVTASGLGANRSAWVNLSHMTTTAGLNLGAKQLATVNTAPDGTLSATVMIPAVPSWTAGTADICLINATAQPVCAPFTLASAEQDATNTATTPDAIVGHYQCSSATLIGFGGGWCLGSEPVLAINGDSTYAFGDEEGSWSFDGATVTFDGELGSATVLNRRLTIDTQVDMPDGSGVQAVRYIYIHMNY